MSMSSLRLARPAALSRPAPRYPRHHAARAVPRASRAAPAPQARGARIGLYGISYSGKSTCLQRLSETAPSIVTAIDSGEMLKRLLAGREWATLAPGEKGLLRREALKGRQGVEIERQLELQSPLGCCC